MRPSWHWQQSVVCSRRGSADHCRRTCGQGVREGTRQGESRGSRVPPCKGEGGARGGRRWACMSPIASRRGMANSAVEEVPMLGSRTDCERDDRRPGLDRNEGGLQFDVRGTEPGRSRTRVHPRAATAIPEASTTGRRSICSPIAPPTTRRESGAGPAGHARHPGPRPALRSLGRRPIRTGREAAPRAGATCSWRKTGRPPRVLLFDRRRLHLGAAGCPVPTGFRSHRGPAHEDVAMPSPSRA